MTGHAFHKVSRFQLLGPGASSFHQIFEVEWISDNSPLVDYSRVPLGAPEVVSVLSDSSPQPARMVTVTARDTGGYRRLRLVQIIANETNTAVDACYLRYQLDNRVLWLMDASGDAAAGVGLPGSLKVLENGKCSVNLAESWPEFRGDTLTLHLDIALKPKVQSTQRVFANAINENGVASRPVEFDAWKPSPKSARENPWNFPPSPPTASVEWKKLTGRDQYLVNVLASDINGVEDIDSMEVIVNNVGDGRNACYLRYDTRAKSVILLNEPGGSAISMEPGASKQLSNSYCAVSTPAPPSVQGHYDISFSFELVLTEKMVNKRAIFLSAVDREGLRQSWRAYSVLPPADPAP
jgi:hypothetical protein